ncbi:MAG: substrate-binding domain-containing protein [Lachnospiraceae bacterium]
MKYKENIEVEESLSEQIEKSKKDAIQGSEIVEIYIITPSYINPFFKAEAEIITKKLKEYGYQVRVVSHTDNTKEQDELFREAIEGEAAAIICDNADSRLSAEMISKAKEEGVITILVDRGIEEEGIAFAQILSDNYQGAALAVKQFIEEMEGEGKYIELLGLESDENAATRSEAFHFHLDKIEEMEMIAQERADWDLTKAQEIISNLLEKNKDVKGIICGNDTMALGALDAVQKANLDHEVIITGMDGSDDVIDEIKKGNIKATVLQPVDKIADTAVTKIHNYLTKEKENPVEVETIPCILVTKENAEYITNFEYHELEKE